MKEVYDLVKSTDTGRKALKCLCMTFGCKTLQFTVHKNKYIHLIGDNLRYGVFPTGPKPKVIDNVYGYTEWREQLGWFIVDVHLSEDLLTDLTDAAATLVHELTHGCAAAFRKNSPLGDDTSEYAAREKELNFYTELGEIGWNRIKVHYTGKPFLVTDPTGKLTIDYTKLRQDQGFDPNNYGKPPETFKRTYFEYGTDEKWTFTKDEVCG